MKQLNVRLPDAWHESLRLLSFNRKESINVLMLTSIHLVLKQYGIATKPSLKDVLKGVWT